MKKYYALLILLALALSSGAAYAGAAFIPSTINDLDTACTPPMSCASNTISVDLSGYLTAESDPKIGTLTTGKWCSTNGSVITCTQDAPSGGSGAVNNVCKTISNPNDADLLLFAINQKGSAWTVNEIRGVAVGGTSVVITIQECDANAANCAAIESAQTVTTGTASTGTITDASIADNAVLKLDIGTVTGAVSQLMVCVEVQ